MKILVPLTVDVGPGLEDCLTARYDATAPITPEHEDAEVLVTWGNPFAQLQEAARRMSALRLVQSLAAGPDVVLRAGFDEHVVLTSGRSLHDRPVAEHALALILAAARRLHVAVRAQRDRRWASEIGGLQPEHDPTAFTTLRGAKVLIWGYGSIATAVTPHLLALGAEVTGVARTPRPQARVPVIPLDRLDAALPDTDVLLMILPATDETTHALDARRLSLLSPRAWVVNVGRGSTVDEAALAASLRERRSGGAALDVTQVEPLPPDSELWDLDNIILTPHAAGGRPLGAWNLIAENVTRLRAGADLINVVAR